MVKHKLLLADDSITIQKVVNLTFADEGIEVISVGDGNSALEKFSEFTPDLVMADINMPGLSGYEICERIKQTAETSHIPVILLVGSFEPFDEAEAQRVGANDYLTKPFQSIRQLVNKVSTLLDAAAGENATTDEFSISAGDGSGFETPQSFSEENYQTQTAPNEQLGDAGMDDEMIQTNQGGFGLDETQKFSARSDFEEDYAKTKPLSPEDLNEISGYQTASSDAASEEPEQPGQNEDSFVNQDTEPESENEEDLSPGNGAAYRADEHPTEELPQAADGESIYQSYQNDSVNPPPAFSNWELDEMNFLEIPPRRGFSEQTEGSPVREEEIAAPEDTQSEMREPTGEMTGGEENSETKFMEEPAEEANLPESTVADDSTLEETFASGASPSSTNLSQDDIDAIARKVAEQISDRVVSQLAPQITDLLVKRIAEEKLRE